MAKKIILILGGAGYIGSYVNKLLQPKFSTIVIDNLSKGYKENVPQGELLIEDFGNVQFLKNLFKTHKIDAILHFAALIDVGESCKDPKKYYENNVVKTLNLLNTMLECKVNNLIFSSFAAVYGNPLKPKITESHPLNPINPYGQTKLMVEKILLDYDKAYGLKSCSLRYFNAAGADPTGELKLHAESMSNLIPVLIHCMQQNKTLQIFGNDYPTKDGTCIRDYIHIHDLATAHELALEYLLNGGKTASFNLGNGEGFSVKEVIETAGDVIGRPIPFVVTGRRPGDPPLLLADSTLAKQELNWNPIYPDLHRIIQDAWKALT